LQLSKQHGIPTEGSTSQTMPRLNSEVKNSVNSFFMRDDISWQALGKKDSVVLRSKDGKKRLQKCFLLFTLKETYSMFCEKYSPESSITPLGFSKLCELRPVEVCLVNELPQTVYIRKYHENIRLLLEVLNKHVPSFPTQFRSFVADVTCTPESKQSMYKKCDTCFSKFEKDFSMMSRNLLTQHGFSGKWLISR